MKVLFPKGFSLMATATCLLVLVGCGNTNQVTSTSAAAPTIDASQYLLENEPEGAEGVIDTRAKSQDQDNVVIIGRIGGSASPWVEGRVAFSIVDLSLKSCAECGSDDCPKPWDYC